MNTTQEQFIERFKNARKNSTPIIAVRTFDVVATVTRIVGSFAVAAPLVQWDWLRGWTPVLTEEQARVASSTDREPPLGELAIASAIKAKDSFNAAPPVDTLPGEIGLFPGRVVGGAPGTVMFVHNAHEVLGDHKAGVEFVQALLNSRDPFKASARTIVLLGPSFNFPAQLAQHVYELDEPLPSQAELRELVKHLAEQADVALDDQTILRAAERLTGLPKFPAEQATVLSLNKAEKSLSLDELGARTRQMVNATPGLEIYGGKESFEDIGGCEQIKKFCRAILSGKRRPKSVVFIDEIEKAMAGASVGGGDTSGVSQGMLGKMLTFMQESEATGMMFVGVPGAAKSAVSKAIGAEGQVPVIMFDMAEMKDSLVGASEQRLSQALKVVQAVSEGDTLFIATSNNIGSLPPELLRRFTLGTWFFDLPTAEEQAGIWNIHKRKTALEGQAHPRNNFTGAEIKNACDIADRTGMPLTEACDFIVPVAVSGAERIEALRMQANGRYLSAACPGWYKYEKPGGLKPLAAAASASSGRVLDVEV